MSDQRFEDFDAQSEQLSGHDQEYFQLSSGRFSGRFVSAFLGGGVSLHLETANRTLEQHVGCPGDVLNIGLVIGGEQPFQVNGTRLDKAQFFVSSPGAQIDLFSPPGGTVLAICIESERLSDWSRRFEDVDPVTDPRGGVAVSEAPDLAQNLSSIAMGVLKSALNADQRESQNSKKNSVGERFLSVMLAQFSLYRTLGSFEHSDNAKTHAILFENARTLMLSNPDADVDYDRLCAELHCSQRSIQMAFSKHADMSPTRYLRTIRLNQARRLLLSSKHSNASIGDLAARSGFWNWSRFSEAYKRQFGELPSETRHRTH